MSDIDKQALREAAEKATPGPWRYLKSTPFMDAEISAKNNTRVVNLLNGDVTADNSEFIAAANPATVLELLDELEAAEKRIEAETDRANREHHRGFMMACKHLEEHANVHYADAAEMEIAALRQRIAELESALKEIRRRAFSARRNSHNSGPFQYSDLCEEIIDATEIVKGAGTGKGE
ncbi:ead/Ea22-like family protein [Citrobacter amalonaticus]|nr:ead/Ea22-like family protein [Citrobacter amalonaticus]